MTPGPGDGEAEEERAGLEWCSQARLGPSNQVSGQLIIIMMISFMCTNVKLRKLLRFDLHLTLPNPNPYT